MSDLRQRAEDAARQRAADSGGEARALSPAESQLLHDLRVHQIELEMQNEELRRAQEEIETSRARYFDLYDLAPVGYCTVSEGGLILEANLTAATLLGSVRAALVGQPLSRFIVAEDQDRYYLHRKQLFTTGTPQVLEVRLRRDSGTQFWARVEATTARNADGVADACRVVLSDISDVKRLEEERLRFERDFQQAQKVESLTRMAGAIAHHFNNQLAVVMGSVELCVVDPRRHEEYLVNALRATRRAADVSGLLLTYLGQSSGNHAPLDLAELCRRSLPLLAAAMPKRLVFEADLPVPGPAVNGNAQQLQLLLTNLVTNAWEAAGDLEATIGLTLTTVPASGIPASRRFGPAWRPRDRVYACLAVTDTGCGIEPQEIETIFDPFFTTKFVGRGLGLPVVMGILHAHDGGLVVESKRGRDSGSVFRVYLPVSSEPVAIPAAAGARAEGPEEMRWDGTVLLVEDEQTLRWTMRTTLARMGFTVLDAKDGTEAVELFQRYRSAIRLVLCDLTMPHMDGWQTLSALRRISPDIPVVLTSGYDEADVMADDPDEKPQAFLAKPHSLVELRGAIQRALVARPR